MGDTAATLVAVGVTVPLTAFLIYIAFRNLIARVRDVGTAIEDERQRRRTIDPNGLRQAESKVAVPPPVPPSSQHADDPREEARSAGATTVSEMAAYFQDQAKKSDDAHKEKIRAHVERPVPPITPEGRETIELGGRARLAIKHVFPPELPQRSMSYFGGLPIVPDNFDWPMVHDREGFLERLTFMAQIDCSDLPPGPGRNLLPDKGYLYFFAPMVDSFGPDAMHFVTRYEPRQAIQKWRPLDIGFTGKVEPNEPMDLIWRGKRTHYDQVEIAFGWIEEPTDDEVAARADEGHAFEVANKIRAEKHEAFFGPPVPHDPLLSAHHAPKDALWTPYPGFPANWSAARILRRFVEAYHREETEDVNERLTKLGEVTDDDPEGQRLRALQHELSAFSSKISRAFFPTINAAVKEYDAPPEEVKQQIMAFLEDLRVNGMPSSKERTYKHLQLPLVINRWLEIAAIHGAEGGLTDPDGAAHIPSDVMAALAYRHSAREHQMLGEGVVVQVAADDMKDRYLLLLQLGPDRALDWLVGEMGPLQYWITPEDLAAKRFENTVLTIEAY